MERTLGDDLSPIVTCLGSLLQEMAHSVLIFQRVELHRKVGETEEGMNSILSYLILIKLYKICKENNLYSRKVRIRKMRILVTKDRELKMWMYSFDSEVQV